MMSGEGDQLGIVQVKFDCINKWYMHKAESILENETHKILCDFEI